MKCVQEHSSPVNMSIRRIRGAIREPYSFVTHSDYKIFYDEKDEETTESRQTARKRLDVSGQAATEIVVEASSPGLTSGQATIALSTDVASDSVLHLE